MLSSWGCRYELLTIPFQFWWMKHSRESLVYPQPWCPGFSIVLSQQSFFSHFEYLCHISPSLATRKSPYFFSCHFVAILYFCSLYFHSFLNVFMAIPEGPLSPWYPLFSFFHALIFIICNFHIGMKSFIEIFPLNPCPLTFPLPS